LRILSAIAVAALVAAAQNVTVSKVGGTLVIAVPIKDGLVVCSDKMLYNETTKTSREDFVRIHKVNDKTLFVATHTTAFLNKAGKMEFDVFDLTQDFVSRHGFHTDRAYWASLTDEIRNKLSAYLTKQKYQYLPETDLANSVAFQSCLFRCRYRYGQELLD